MIQAHGLTGNPHGKPSSSVEGATVEDVSFEAPEGQVTALLGDAPGDRTQVLRLLLGLESGRGVAYFRGRTLETCVRPCREVGVLLAGPSGHPARTVLGYLRMLCAAVGVGTERADAVLDVVGMKPLAREPLGRLARGMERRLGLAVALLGDPHTLVLDDPTADVSPREARWLHGLLRAHADQGGTVLFSTGNAQEAAGAADRVVVLCEGRVVADQAASEFARTRLRPRVAVRSPYAARLGVLLHRDARVSRRSVEVVKEDGNRISVYGSTCAEVGSLAHRHSILVHQLSEEKGDLGVRAHEGKAGAPVEGGCPEAGALVGAASELPPAATGVHGAPESAADRERGGHLARDETAIGTRLLDGGRRTDPATPGSAGDPGVDAADEVVGRNSAGGTDTSARSGRNSGTASKRSAARPGPGRATAPGADSSGSAQSGPEAADPEAPGPKAARPDTAGPEPVVTGSAPAGGPDPAQAAGIDTALSATHGPSRQPDAAGRAAEAPQGSGGRHSQLPPPFSPRRSHLPLFPLLYELRRAGGVAAAYVTAAAVVVLSALVSVLMARSGHSPQPRVLSAWSYLLPLPPAALGAGFLGASSFGEEFRHPVLATDRRSVPRRLTLLGAKLAVTAAMALTLALLVAVADAALLRLVYGPEFAVVPDGWPAQAAVWGGLVTGCAWAGLLAAGVFRSTAAGLAAVLAVPVVVAPLLERATRGPAAHGTEGFPGRLRDLTLVQWPFGAEGHFADAVQLALQPVGGALLLSLGALSSAYAYHSLRTRAQ